MQPGLSRAIPLGILGFLIGMVILAVIRGLQSLQPLMEPELGIIMGTLFAAGFFIYGMGAFDPRMNQHAHEPAEGEDEHALAVAHEVEEEAAPPGQILGGYLWQLSTILLGVLLLIIIFALLPEGPALRTVHEPTSSVAAVGTVPIEIGGQTYHLSQLTLLLGFVVFMFISLAVVAGGMGAVFFALNQGATRVRETSHTPFKSELLDNMPDTRATQVRWIVGAVVVTLGFALLDTLIGTPITAEFSTLSFFLSAACVFTVSFIALGFFIRVVAAQTQWAWLVRAIIILTVVGLVLNVVDFLIIWFGLSGLTVVSAVIFNLVILIGLVMLRMYAAVLFTILSGILMPLFYFVLIGLIVPFAPPLLFGISAGNALLIAAFIVRPKFLTQWISYGARWTAQQLRRLPNGLQ